jgi:hypothetical protein
LVEGVVAGPSNPITRLGCNAHYYAAAPLRTPLIPNHQSPLQTFFLLTIHYPLLTFIQTFPSRPEKVNLDALANRSICLAGQETTECHFSNRLPTYTENLGP